MSYILDALKKAERDRLREQPKDFDDLTGAHWDPYTNQNAPDNITESSKNLEIDDEIPF